ncbi:hypothetical protein Taro_048539, partial [Colocasia esculenta]|nr:hypothetical protein [Colocasia esculenta]
LQRASHPRCLRRRRPPLVLQSPPHLPPPPPARDPLGPAAAPSPFPSFFLWLFSATCVSPAVYLLHPCRTVFQRGEGQLDLRCRPPSHHRRTAICAERSSSHCSPRPETPTRPRGDRSSPSASAGARVPGSRRTAQLRGARPCAIPLCSRPSSHRPRPPLTSWGQHCLRLDPPPPSAAVVQHRLCPDPTQPNDLPADDFRWWLVQWFEATETAYYHAADFSYTLHLGGICSCSLDGWLYNFYSRLGVEDIDIGAPPELIFRWDRKTNIDKEMLMHMSSMHRTWRGVLKKRHYTGKSFEDVIASVPADVNPCKELPDGTEQWADDESMSRYERMIQLSATSLDSESGSTPISAEAAFVLVMGKDRSGRIRCGGSRETRRTLYGTGEGPSSTDYQQQVNNIENTLRMEVEELRTEARRRDSEMDEMQRELEQLRK